MLRVRAKVGTSKIAGAGLFAEELILKDTIVWEYTAGIDLVFTEPEIESMHPIDRDFMYTYCFKYNGKYILCVDNARFFNHSDDPNCYSSGYTPDFLGYTKALRDILPGEEITDNYKVFGISDDDNKFNGTF